MLKVKPSDLNNSSVYVLFLIIRLVPTLGEDLLLAVLNYPGCRVHRDFSREAKFADFAFRVNDPAALSFFVRNFARGLECFAQVFVVLPTDITPVLSDWSCCPEAGPWQQSLV